MKILLFLLSLYFIAGCAKQNVYTKPIVDINYETICVSQQITTTKLPLKTLQDIIKNDNIKNLYIEYLKSENANSRQCFISIIQGLVNKK
jgi:hypothetical protein